MKTVIFFRSSREFVPPTAANFPDDFGAFRLVTVDIPDWYDAIRDSWERIAGELFNATKGTETAYICVAGPLGFVWMLRGWLEGSDRKYIFLQMDRNKETGHSLKKYSEWEEVD